MSDDQRVDAILRHAVARALLGDRDALRRGRGDVEHTGIDEPVVHDDIGRLQRLDGANGEEAGIARTGADEDDAPARRGIEKTCHAGEFGPGRRPRQRMDAWAPGSETFALTSFGSAGVGGRRAFHFHHGSPAKAGVQSLDRRACGSGPPPARGNGGSTRAQSSLSPMPMLARAESASLETTG